MPPQAHATGLVGLAFLLLLSPEPAAGQQTAPEEAVFAMGCFWCGEEAMENVPGVISAVSGYTGGTTENPTYYDVVKQNTGHYEAVRVTFDPSQISYEQLLEFFWHNIIPIQGDGQFCDRGSAYQSAIFYANAAQKQVAEASPKAIADAMPDGWQGEDIKTRILPLKTFYVAEDYHQDYYKKEPNLYARYKLGCGRADALKSFWGEEAYAMYNAVTKAPSLAPGAGSSLPLQGGFTSASGGLVLGSSNPPVDATEIFGGSLTGESYGGDTSGADNSGGVWLARSGGDVAAGITLLAWLALATVW